MTGSGADSVSPRTGLSIFAAVSQLRRVIFLAPLLILGAWMMATALESPAYWWLGWVTLVPLLLSIKLLCTVDAGIAGAIWGMSLYFSTGSSDPSASAHVLPHGFLPLLVLMLVPAGYAAAASEITRRKGFHPLLLGLGWVGVELAIRPLGIHHGLLAHTQGDGLIVQGVGHLGGYALVAFVIALTNAMVAAVITSVRLEDSRAEVKLVASHRRMRSWIYATVTCSRHFASAIQTRGPPAIVFA